MSRTAAPLFTVLLALLLGVTVSAPAGAAPASADGPSVVRPSDDGEDVPADVPDPAGADDPTDNIDLGDLCSTLGDTGDDGAGAVDDNADAGGAAARSADAGDGADPADVPDPADSADQADASDDPADDPTDGIDCADDSETDAPDEAADGGTDGIGLKTLLRKGWLDTGSVTVSGPATVRQQLWLDRGTSGARRIVAGAARQRTAGKSRTKGGGGRVLGGSVTRSIRQAGVVHLSIRLSPAARKLLRNTTQDIRITVKTVTKVRRAKARTRTGTVVVRRAV